MFAGVKKTKKKLLDNISLQCKNLHLNLWQQVTLGFFPGRFKEKQAVNELLSMYKEDSSALSSHKNKPLTPA